jgi:sulfur carrier protein ThiS
MNKEQFHDYIDCFNRDDFAGFSRYYTDDVLLELPKMQLRGPRAIVDFYRVVKARIRETLKINQVIADSEGLAAEVDTEFLALEDWPDFIVGPVKKGDAIRIVSFVHYKIRDGRFAHIKSARFRTLT